MTPVIRAIARDLVGRARVALVDVDRLPHLKARYGVESVPAVLLFRGGAPVGRVLGTMPRRTLMARIDSLLRGVATEPE
jgi:thioredoxin-like negative regulator of GroEL